MASGSTIDFADDGNPSGGTGVTDHQELTNRTASNAHPLASITDLATALLGKQATLESGVNIKTINSTSLLGAGDIEIVVEGDGSHIHLNLDALDDVSGVNTGDQDLSGYSTDIHANITALDLVSGTNTGDQDLTDLHTHTNAADLANVSGTNTGDQDLSDYSTDIHSNITALDLVSGTNTGDQDLSGYSVTTHNHNLNDLTEKSYDSLTEKPTIPSLPIAISDVTNLQITVDGKENFHGIQASGALSFDNTTHILTMASGTNTYWYKGTKYTIASAITCDLDSYVTLTANTTYFVGFDDASGTLKASASAWNFTENVFVATVFWNGSAGATSKELHSHTRDLDWHKWAHDTIGSRYEAGLSLTNPTTTNDALLQIESGTIHDEDQDITIAQQTTMRGYYQASSGVYTFADYTLPYLGTSGQPQYLDTDTYTLTNVGSAKFVNYWVYATNDIARPISIIPSHIATDYTTIALARLETPPVLSSLNISADWKLIYRFIYKGDGQFQESADYRSASPLPSGGTSSTTAGAVSFIPAGNISATTVQSAIEELDSEKMSNLNVTTGTSLTIDFATYNYHISTVTGNVSFSLSNVPTNKFVTVLVKNTGGGVVTLPNTADVKSALTFTHAANKWREYSILYDGTTRYWQVSEELT